jgi:hypothetical protein
MSPDELTAAESGKSQFDFIDPTRREFVAFLRASGQNEAFILRMLLQPKTRKPAWENAAEDLLMYYGNWMTVPDDELERRGVTRGQLLAKVIDSGPGPITYAKIVSYPVPRGSQVILAPVIPIQTASRGRRVLPRSRRRRTTATRRGPPSSKEDSDPDPPLDLLDAAVLVLGWGRVA